MRTTLMIVITVCMLPGCSQPPIGNDNATANDNGVDNSNSNGDAMDVEPGTNFDNAQTVALGKGDRAVLDGTIVSSDEVHVYDIGVVARGDRVEISAVTRNGPNLDPMIALFDADGFRLFWNDDVNQRVGNFNSQIIDSIRHDSVPTYVAIAASNFSMTTGDYRLTVQMERQVSVVEPRGQTLVLNWEFEPDVVIARTPFGDANGIDASSIQSSFAGRDDELKAGILAIVREDFADFDLTILTSDDPEPSGPFSTVYFANEAVLQIFGLSDEVDFYNGSDQDNAIIFQAAFSDLGSDFNAIVQALGNVTSHEIGHTVGLMHTTDPNELMDTTGADETLLDDQGLGTASLFDFPVGLQNSGLLLEETLGRSAAMHLPLVDGQLRCGTCGRTLRKIVRRVDR